MQLRAKVLPAQVLKHTCLIKEKPLEMCLLRQVTAESGGEFCGKTDGPATILNHVNGSRNQVESLVKSGIRNQTLAIIPVNLVVNH